MRILLPPSETKRVGGERDFAEAALSLGVQLREPRRRVREALEAVSVYDAASIKALKLGKKNQDERLRNLELDTSGAMPAIERYTGVLYDALAVRELPDTARYWVDEHVLVQSALFGLLRAPDPIPAYRLSASSRLPELGCALARLWADAHGEALAGEPYVLDLRSKDYAGLAPLERLGAQQTDYLEVVSRGADGEVRALNHFNKAAKGDLVRRLSLASAGLRSRADLLAWAGETGIELVAGEGAAPLRLVTDQGVPAKSR